MKLNRVRRSIAILYAISAIAAVSVWALRYNTLIPTSMADEPSANQPQSSPPSLPPLVIDKSTPLLLDDPGDKETAKEMSFLRINSACYVCHDNFKDELLAVVHAKEEIGCVECHGPSLEHCNDEDNITPPGIMYPLAKIDSLCQECHDSHDVAAKEVLKCWNERCPEQTDFDKVVCTDCHGYHRLKKRTVRWDKETGDVIIQAPAEKTDK